MLEPPGKKHLSILIVDDSEDDYVLMRDMLEDIEDYSVDTVWCKGYDDGVMEAVNGHDVCLIDYILGGKNGVELIEDAVAAGSVSPMIIFTARGNHHVDIDAMNRGAVDYLTKGDFNEALLERTIRYAMDRKHSECMLAEANASLEEKVAERTKALNKANEKLQRRQRTLQTLLDNAPVAIWMADSRQRIHFINQTLLDMLGIEKQQALSAQQYDELLPEGIREQWRLSDSACFQHGIIHSREEWVGQDGAIRTFDMVKARVAGEQGRLVGIGIDMSRQLELQAQMEHAQQLESMGVLAGGIAHDFNNILAIIMTNAGLAKLSLESPATVDRTLNHIMDASERAAGLCTQMMAYAGKIKSDFQAIDLSEMVVSMNDLMRVAIARNITVEHNGSGQNLAISADASQLQQVVMNLIINAAEAIGEHQSGLITITTGKMTADRSYLHSTVNDHGLEAGEYCFVEVSDNGCGMDANTMKHLFEPFFTTKFTGRGLGMSAMLGIVQEHHGAIKIDSEMGQGTSIRVLFPLLTDARPHAEIQTESQQLWQGHGTALLVDDEAQMREVLSELMTRMGFDVIQAEDGLAAVDAFRQHQDNITIVILDLAMPRMDGAACFYKLRAMQADVKVILSSGYSMREATARFVGKGLAGFVQKPFRTEKLEAAIQLAFSRSKPEQ